MIGTEQSRLHFFNDLDINSDFLLIYGKENDINNYLKTFKVKANRLDLRIKAIFYAEQVDLRDLNSVGLKAGENTSTFVLSTNGNKVTNAFLSNYQIQAHSPRKCYYDNTCTSSLKCFLTPTATICRKMFDFYPFDGDVAVQIPLKVLNTAGDRVPYPDNTLGSSSYYTNNGKQIYLNQVLLAGSTLTINVKRPIREDLVVNMNLFDKSNKYLPFQ